MSAVKYNPLIILLIFSFLNFCYNPAFANNKQTTNNNLPNEIPQHVIDFTAMHTTNKKYDPNNIINYEGKWNEFNVYSSYPKSLFGKCCGLPIYMLDNGKVIRYASGCERDEIMSNGKVKCKKPLDSRIEYYEY